MNLDEIRRMTPSEKLELSARMWEEWKLRAEQRLRRFRPNLSQEQLRAMRIRHANRDTARKMEINRRIRAREQNMR